MREAGGGGRSGMRHNPHFHSALARAQPAPPVTLVGRRIARLEVTENTRATAQCRRSPCSLQFLGVDDEVVARVALAVRSDAPIKRQPKHLRAAPSTTEHQQPPPKWGCGRGSASGRPPNRAFVGQADDLAGAKLPRLHARRSARRLQGRHQIRPVLSPSIHPHLLLSGISFK